MVKLTAEDKIIQEILEELRKIDVNPNEYDFYLTDEKDKIYMIKPSNTPKPIKLIFEN